MARDKRLFGNIRRLPSGRYQCRFTDPDGRYVTAPHTFAARIDAEAWLADRRREIDTGLYSTPGVKPSKITFGDYAATWLANRHVAGRPIKARTRDHYRAILDAHLLPEFVPGRWRQSRRRTFVTGTPPPWPTGPPCAPTPTACCGPS